MIVAPAHNEGGVTVAIGIKRGCPTYDFNPYKARVISFIPLDENYELSKHFPWLAINLKDKRQIAGNLIEDWWVKCRFKHKIIPLIEDWGIAYCLLDLLLGKLKDDTSLINKYFDPRRRIDIIGIRHFLMDNSYFSGQEYPFMQNPELSSVQGKLNVAGAKNVNLYADAERLVRIYKAINNNFIFDMPRKHQLV